MKFLFDKTNKYINDKLKEKYAKNFKSRIFDEKAENAYRYLYIAKEISRDNILEFIEVRLFMGIYKYNCIDKYWSLDIL